MSFSVTELISLQSQSETVGACVDTKKVRVRHVKKSNSGYLQFIKRKSIGSFQTLEYVRMRSQ